MPTTFAIPGVNSLHGSVSISGSKNAALALITASILTSGQTTLQNVPQISDIDNQCAILSHLGVLISRAKTTLHLDTTNLQSRDIPPYLTGKLRASVLILGALLARFGHARIGVPGGCRLGKRSIDQHVTGLEQLGACVKIDAGWIEGYVPSSGLRGAVVRLQTPTVLGTENLMLAACLAQGTTHIRNAAQEPEVVDLARCLAGMGVGVGGAGTSNLVIQGRREYVRPVRYRVMEDRIEAGTFLILGAMLGNPLTVRGCRADYQRELIRVLRGVGAVVNVEGKQTVVVYRAMRPRAMNVSTGPYGAFPTDLQPQLMALLATARGVSRVEETIFEQRFNQVAGLRSMGADIDVQGQVAVVRGVSHLSGSIVDARDLRAGASLVLAAVGAHGVTCVQSVEHIDRGYDDFENKLRGLGVSIRRVPES
ncbi:hypothetical protein FE257_011345 [Aspergillus nanangensis]|uniref:UDP-N-acetylglucosamine 1-carboxyvinyltransferase n=1 Tax=Aspergillus nanangensis TaxID=2582783 RepID=A0AAD4GSM9_ASPNN|nr:hypothetical protein FE257_011345 [Aspergillus nanangensis]